jgi:hypothetical protein
MNVSGRKQGGSGPPPMMTHTLVTLTLRQVNDTMLVRV